MSFKPITPKVEFYGKRAVICLIIVGDLTCPPVFFDKEEYFQMGPKVIQRKILKIKTGDQIAFFDNDAIRTGNFVCNSVGTSLKSKDILSQLLNTEEELRGFCKTYNIGNWSHDPLFRQGF